MSCDEYREQLMAYLDGELEGIEARKVRSHLDECEACRAELAKFEKLKEVSTTMKFIKPTDEVWDRHWTGIYNRVERGVAWVFLSIAAIIFGVFGVYHLCADFFADSAVNLCLKIGVGALIVGGITLFVSVVRERITTYRVDPYREVKR
jgi:hypothetical protein